MESFLSLEDKDSWSGHVKRRQLQLQSNGKEYDFRQPVHGMTGGSTSTSLAFDRVLKHHKTKEEKRQKKIKKLLADPGIRIDTMVRACLYSYWNFLYSAYLSFSN